MSRIGSVGQLGTSQLTILHHLQRATQGLAESSLRLATLKKINRAADNPSGLVMAQRLEAELAAVSAASSNVTRAQGLISTADAAASDIVSKLEDAYTLALEVAGGTLSPSEISAKQAELDDVLDAIDRTARTEYNGTRLLDGSSGYRVSGVDTADIVDVDVISKSTSDDVSVTINVTTPAEQGAKNYTGGALGADTVLEITGSEGTATVELSSGATTQDITDAINDVSHLTGVTATRIDATDIDFATSEYGSDATIDITALEGTFTTTGTGDGVDAVATVNGQTVTADGTVLSIHTGNVSLQVDLDPAASGAIAAFTVSGTGLEFRVSTNINDDARIGLANLRTSSLGGSTGRLSTLRSGQDNSLTAGESVTTLQILDEALSEARTAQARIGAFDRYTLDSATSVLDAQEENLSLAYSDVMDTDIAEETSRAARWTLLQESALESLAVLNYQQSSLLDLLRSFTARL
jgi:flagellin